MLDQLMPIVQTATQLPLQYGGMYNQSFNPVYSYLNNQAGNMTQLGNQGISAYTNLMGQEANERMAAMPYQMQGAMFNAVAPALSGLLSQYAPGIPGLGNFQMPKFGGGGRGVSGLQGLMNDAYSRAGSYDDQFMGQFNRNLGMLPKAPYLNAPAASAPQYSANKSFISPAGGFGDDNPAVAAAGQQFYPGSRGPRFFHTVVDDAPGDAKYGERMRPAPLPPVNYGKSPRVTPPPGQGVPYAPPVNYNSGQRRPNPGEARNYR
jgi:hypothetical protein